VKITVSIEPAKNKKQVEVPKGSKVLDIIQKINLKPDAVIVLLDNIPIPVDEILNDEQKLNIIQVASGG